MSASASPVVQLAVGGAVCGTVTSVELLSTAYRRAGTFSATVAIDPADPVVAALLESGATPEANVPVTIALALDPFPGTAWVPMFQGSVDQLSHDVGEGRLTISGRDQTASLIDLIVTEQFTNRTSSEIASFLAGQAGLAANIAQTTTFAGQYYQIDHARSALSSFTRFASAWEVLCGLADLEGFECWVSNGTLNFVPSASAVGATIPLDVAALQAGLPCALAVTRLCLDRRLALDAGVSVTVRSWNSRQKAVVEQTAGGATADSGKIVFVVPNATDEVAVAKAASLYRDVARHGRAIGADVAGELSLAPRDVIALSGTAGGGWDGAYVVDLVTRRIDACAGFEESFVAHALITT